MTGTETSLLILTSVLAVGFFALVVGLAYLVYRDAKNNAKAGQSAELWGIITLVNPILAVLLYWQLGRDPEKTDDTDVKEVFGTVEEEQEETEDENSTEETN